MKNLIEIKKKITSDWFESLQSKIIDQFQLLENEASKKNRKKIKDKLKVPLSGKARSLNVAMTVAIVASEALKQNNFFK